MKVLVLFAHPAFHKSHTNKVLVEGVNELNNVTFHDLYEKYPDFDIDVIYEQQLMQSHDCIIFHFPFFWYSTPAILKEYQDLVLQHGWAYGSKGNALKDKFFFTVLTTGGPRQAYTKTGFHKHTLLELLAPIRQSASLCKMKNLPPFVVHGTHSLEHALIEKYKEDYFELLKLLVSDEIDFDKIHNFDYLNDYINRED